MVCHVKQHSLHADDIDGSCSSEEEWQEEEEEGGEEEKEEEEEEEEERKREDDEEEEEGEETYRKNQMKRKSRKKGPGKKTQKKGIKKESLKKEHKNKSRKKEVKNKNGKNGIKKDDPSESVVSIEDQHLCWICGELVNNRKLLVSHMLKSHSEGWKPYFVCEFCGRKLASFNRLRYHCKSRHNKLPTRSTLTCHICGMYGYYSGLLFNDIAHRLSCKCFISLLLLGPLKSIIFKMGWKVLFLWNHNNYVFKFVSYFKPGYYYIF